MTLDDFRALAATGGPAAVARHIAETLARIGGYNTTTQADAAQIADLLGSGGPGPLSGLPIGVKDNIDALPFATTGGSPALQGHVPAADAPPVARLRDAGAVPVMKLNLHEFAFGVTSNNALYGPVRNPVDPERVAGGSSGGNASAIALGLIPAALGTDTGGSVRIPAAFCGICGFRPSTGRYPDGGVLTISATRDTIGPMAATVADCATLDGIVAGDETLPALPDRPLRLGIASDIRPGLSAQVDDAMTKALDLLEAADITLIHVDAADIDAATILHGDPVAFCEGRASFSRLARDLVGLSYDDVAAKVASPDVAGIFAALPMLAEQTRKAWQTAIATALPRLKGDWSALLDAAGVDAILSATVPVPPPLIGEDETMAVEGADLPTFPTIVRNTTRASMLGTPSLSLPAGRDSQGLPVGLMVEGRTGEDRRVLAIGLALEAVLAPCNTVQETRK
ncbi:amidase family protein [Chachezhania sediminis]|uniref:amidase family protein n=1 Tax=Chachezhania sediminis TaxID=2599291 RepID=UPI00131E276A|nr:amidase family protein [Chachezhania sediminis]